MDGHALALGTAVLSGVNTLTLIVIAWRGGRWTGRVDERLDHLDKCVDSLKQEGLRGQDSKDARQAR